MDEAFAHIEGNGKRHCKKDMIPPDGGWGYVVCVGVGFTFMLGFGSSNAFGILFHNFFTEQGSGSGLPLVIGVYNGALSISGFLSGIALKRYSFRQVGLVGAGLFVLGDVLTIFVQRTYQLVFTFGVVRGAGFGVMIPVSFTAFNCYFTKRRTAMMSANQTMSSMASITFPILVTYLLAEYGFRWTLALIMAVDLHLVFAMLVMHPVEWHLIKNPDVCQGDDTEVKEKLPKRHESIQKSIIKMICENVELDLLKDPRFVSTLVGLGFAFVSDMEVATCVMVGAIADLVARFLLAVFTFFYSVDSRKIFFGGTCITIMLRIGVIYEATGSYTYCFLAMSFCCMICVVLWTIEYIIYLENIKQKSIKSRQFYDKEFTKNINLGTKELYFLFNY
ncbi:hypothetical protein MSG28_001725 [Choristoneura fumiferana]|uniref:Uncharacterized protein n=1 Tax=Choristoneura fumiferana TaxID=7141 RepID=A0ACC0KV57_CHOFU|nr:hypothetical protein MSG28_001725 [Choristoneura fumiferana]